MNWPQQSRSNPRLLIQGESEPIELDQIWVRGSITPENDEVTAVGASQPNSAKLAEAARNAVIPHASRMLGEYNQALTGNPRLIRSREIRAIASANG